MSESDISESESDISESDGINFQQPTWDILAEHQGIKIDEKFIIKLQKGTKNVIKEVKDSCKVLRFSSEWNFEDILTTINGLDSKDYPQLFIFVIEVKNYGFIAANQAEFSKSSLKLQEKLTKFGFFRPMILQITSEAENVRKIWFKNENSNQFTTIEQQQDESDKPNALPSFLRIFMNNFNNSELDILDYLQGLENRVLTVRFLRALNLTDGFFGGMILNMATSGTRDEFIAALDAPFDNEGRMLSIRAQEYIADVFEDDDDRENDDSVLLKALNNNNKDVIDYLITYWSHLIQLLPIKHKIKISTAAFETNQLDILCDLISIADFPFPKDFKVDSVEHPRLKKIEAERVELKAAIKAENFGKINEFINANLNLRFIFSPSNKSALTEAIKLKKFGVFYYLKSLGFKGEDCDKIIKDLPEEERKQAEKQEAEQRKKNISQSQDIAPKSVMKLLMRSSIHNSRTNKEQQAQYRANIMKWFTAIHKVSSELIDVAATCEHLKIIFDFESDSVENVSLTGSSASGSTYPISKWIIIGAKLSDEYGNIIKQREQKIKGVLAHELCHYVMRLVYENQECPYFKHKVDLKEMFEAIVQAIDKWSAEDSEKPNDECNGIISSVFTAYKLKDFQQELIVRVVHMLTEYDDNEAQTRNLEEKYKILFEFWRDHVIPELMNYLLRNKDIVKLNGFAELLHRISQHQIEVKPGKPIEELISSKLTIVTTNHPQLLFIDICKNLKEKYGVLMDTKNFFVEPEKLTNSTIFNELKLICTENSELSIYIDCTNGDFKSLGEIFVNKKLRFIFVVSNQQQCEELVKTCVQKELKNVTKMEINYSWSDLTEESQNLLLENKIKFQNSPNISLCDLLKNEKKAVQDFTQIINDQLLNFLVEKKNVFINEKVEDKEENFEFIYQSRKFVKKAKDEKDQVGAEGDREFSKRNEKEASIISQKDLLSEVKIKQYVLISDQAGNGKSWATKNITNILQEQNPTNWVTYVDLKQFIDSFKTQKADPEFSSFMVEHILKPQHQFEAKVFQQLYRDGKVFILFDGFDEIAPNYAELVSKLAQNFQQNGGNQLWIATRDFFEVDLKKKLNLDIAYSLDEMTEIEGVDLIARSWMLEDLRKEKQKTASKQEFDEYIKKSTKYKNYQQKAWKIINKALIRRNNPVGLPQLFKMIADGFKDEENVDDLQGIKIYDKLIDILYKRWSQQKGQIRNQANTEVQKNDSSFFMFLRFHAILSFFPELAKILFPNCNGSEWPREEIIACGILTIINGKVYFIHETFREYFAADSIAKALKKPEVDENVVEVFVEILTVEKFGVTRVFLNDMITDSSVVIKIQNQVQKHIKKFAKMSSFGDFFPDNLQNLVDLVLNVLKTGNYKKVEEILQNSAKHIAKCTEDSKMFLKFQELIFDYLKVNDLKDLINNGEVFQGMINSGLEIEVFEDFVAKTKAKIGQKFAKQALMLMSDDGFWQKNNIFYFLAESSNLNAQKVQIFLKIMENFFTVTEIFELMSYCNGNEQNILQVCVKKENEENLKILWTETEKYFAEQNLPQSFEEFVKQQYWRRKNILHAVAWCDKIEVHETLWELLLKLIDDREELEDFILQKDKYGNNCVHELVLVNKNPAIVEWTFKILKENFSDAQFQEILTSKGYYERNLLQSAAYESKVVEVHQFLWKFFRDFCGTDEKFLEMLKEDDEIGENILHIAAITWKSSSEVFEFMIRELEKITSRDDIREMLRYLSSWNRNLMQSAAQWNTSLELHKTLWKTLRKYFEKSEISQFINNVDKDGNNLLFKAFWTNSKKIVELTWNEIKSFLNHDEQVKYLKMKGKDGKNLLECALGNYEGNRDEIHRWVKNIMQEYEIEFLIPQKKTS